MILFAVAASIPGSEASCSAEARLMSILAGPLALPAFFSVFAGAASCALTTAGVATRANTKQSEASLMRSFMVGNGLIEARVLLPQMLCV